MAKDYKHSRRPKDRNKAKKIDAPMWLVFATGLAAGLFVAVLVFLQQEKTQQQTVANPEPKAAQAAAGDKAKTADKPADKPAPVVNLDIPTPHKDREKVVMRIEQDKPEKDAKVQVNEAGGVRTYTFYNELEKGQELPLPDDKTVEQRKGDLYVLQAGSFRRFADADRLRARLALLNIESKVQTVTMDGGEVWYRVRVGPSSSYREIDRIRRRMNSGNINSMLMTIRKDS